ncbi:hypothetical protein FOZ60_016047 [Perkinsus olseni]|uniref:TTF-type domain-containing protein n=1 Tax=Perkinsus olseni TaxID=32597 RepID=A0A7J6N4I3_PEROL|nr:hypothetical protein FOZ60_016047 [Perkinsus olseni]
MEPFLKRGRTGSEYPGDISATKADGRVEVKGKKFPSNAGGRSFLPAWQEKYAWLEYSAEKDSVFCYHCRHFGAPRAAKSSPFFGDPNGFSNWKKATQRFEEHAASDYHRNAMEAFLDWSLMKESGQSVAASLAKQNEKVIRENRHYLKVILQCVVFCCKQGIALRGHRENLSAEGNASNNPGNFLELARLLSRFDDVVKERMTTGPGNSRYLHHSIQDDLIGSAATLIRRSVASEVGGCGAFSLICDEAKDISHSERLSLCVRYVHDCQIREEFLAFARCDKLDAASLTTTIFETLGNVGISPSLMVSQCYDGASVMKGQVSGVSQRVRDRASPSKSAVYIHCFAHRLCQDLHHFLATSVVSPIFKKKQEEGRPGEQVRMVPALSETRWTCQYRALDTLVVTMPSIFDTLDFFEGEGGDRGGTARGLRLRLDAEFMVKLITMRWVLHMTADVAESLQDKEHTLARGLADVDNVLTRLHRPPLAEVDEVWNELWTEAQSLIEVLEIPELAGRRRRRVRADYRATGVTSDDFRKDMFVPLCKSVRFELLRRFKAPENVPVYAGGDGIDSWM